MAKFKKGDPKRAGRTKGTPNKTTEQFRSMIKKFVLDNWGSLQADFNKMKPGERVLFLERLMKYFVPEAIHPEKLSEENYKEIIEYFQNKINEQTIRK
jgi:hypothetical protein